LSLLLFLVIGWVIGKKGHQSSELTSGLVFFIMRVTLPSIIIISMQRAPTPELLTQGVETLLLSLGFYAITALLGFLLMPILPVAKHHKGLWQFVALFGNVGFMGFPVMEALFGRESLFFVAIFNLPFNFFIFTYGVYLLRKDQPKRDDLPQNGWKEILFSPVILSLFAATALFLGGIRLPDILFQPLELLGNMTSTLSMVTIGIMLSRIPIKSALLRPSLWVLTMVRLVIVPILILVALILLPVSPVSSRVALILTAMPAAANTPILASEHGGKAEAAGQVVLLTSLAVFFTLPLIIMLGSSLKPGFLN